MVMKNFNPFRICRKQERIVYMVPLRLSPCVCGLALNVDLTCGIHTHTHTAVSQLYWQEVYNGFGWLCI